MVLVWLLRMDSVDVLLADWLWDTVLWRLDLGDFSKAALAR